MRGVRDFSMTDHGTSRVAMYRRRRLVCYLNVHLIDTLYKHGLPIYRGPVGHSDHRGAVVGLSRDSNLTQIYDVVDNHEIFKTFQRMLQ